jgi:hypothetical protein
VAVLEKGSQVTHELPKGPTLVVFTQKIFDLFGGIEILFSSLFGDILPIYRN